MKLRLMTTCLLLAATATLARADELAAPPPHMQGGVAVDLSHAGEGVERVKIGGADALVVHGSDGESTHLLAEIAKPEVKSPRYLVKGWVKYDDVVGDGYMELWNHFGDDAYFSRTMGDKGPMGKLSGKSGWRVFLLPFNSEPGKTPDKLTLNVVLPGHGTVVVTDVRLVDAGTAAPPSTAPAATATHSELPTPTGVGSSSRVADVLLISILTVLLVAMAAMLTTLVVRSRLRRAPTVVELRRMQAMDSV